MRVNIEGKWYDSRDTAIVVKIDKQELGHINSIQRSPENEDVPRVYASFPDDWGSPDEMRAYMKDE